MQAAAHHHDRLALRLLVEPRAVTIGRRAAAQFGEESGCNEPTLWNIRLSVSEALSNAVLHAYAEDADDPHQLMLEAEADERRVRITVSDDGCGLRARADSPGMGLGLALIANSCDELSLDTGPDGGTVVRMTFLR